MKLKQGQKVKSCILADGSIFKIGEAGVTEMSISMEAGKEFFTPWILLICDDQKNEPLLLNCANLEAVHILIEDPQ